MRSSKKIRVGLEKIFSTALKTKRDGILSNSKITVVEMIKIIEYHSIVVIES